MDKTYILKINNAKDNWQVELSEALNELAINADVGIWIFELDETGKVEAEKILKGK
jgi:hypothetical protein